MPHKQIAAINMMCAIVKLRSTKHLIDFIKMPVEEYASLI